MPTGIVKILYTHAHSANAHTLAQARSKCTLLILQPSQRGLGSNLPDSVLLAARPTLHLGLSTMFAASSTQPHPYNHRANMHTLGDTIGLSFSIMPHPYNHRANMHTAQPHHRYTIGQCEHTIQHQRSQKAPPQAILLLLPNGSRIFWRPHFVRVGPLGCAKICAAALWA